MHASNNADCKSALLCSYCHLILRLVLVLVLPHAKLMQTVSSKCYGKKTALQKLGHSIWSDYCAIIIMIRLVPQYLIVTQISSSMVLVLYMCMHSALTSKLCRSSVHVLNCHNNILITPTIKGRGHRSIIG